MSNGPIRVLNLFTLLDRGGAETMCMNLYRNIDRSKIQFDFLVYYPQRGEYEDEIESLGGRIYRIPHLDPKNLYAHIKGARIFLKEHPEYNIVHDHMGENGAFICREAKKSGVKTIIYHSHTDKVPFYHFPFSIDAKLLKLRLLYPVAMNNITDKFACGKNSAKVFKSGSKVYLLNNSINIERFQFNPAIRKKKRNELNLDNKLVIGNVARINDNKNQSFAINVISELVERNINCEMWFIGDGPLRKDLEEMAKNKRLDDRIRFLGIRSDVNELLQAMDVFLFPSKKEGLPVSCIEAQAAGLPCVFSDGFDPETKITANCKTLSLDDSIEKWAEAILSYSDFERVDTSEIVRKAGYDIKVTSKRMERFYLSRAGR